MMHKRWMAFRYAFRGMITGFRSEVHIRLHVLATLGVTGLGLYVGLKPLEWVAIILCIAAVISTELMNAALEKLADRVHPEKDPLIGMAKDIAAGAVLITAIAALIIGLILFLPYFF